MKDEIFEKNPVLKGVMSVIVCSIFVFFGLYCIWKPEDVLNRYIQNFKMGTEFKWYDPSTFLRKSPPLYLVRLIGIGCVFTGTIGFYAIFAWLTGG